MKEVKIERVDNGFVVTIEGRRHVTLVEDGEQEVYVIEASQDDDWFVRFGTVTR